MQRPLRLTQGQSQGNAITARAQLTLVEHALCPLDAGASLTPNFSFTTTHFFTDPHRNRRKATVRIGAIDGLSAHDELYLWGLLAIALTQRDQRSEFMASPYFCLRRLGLIDADRKGGREFELFRAAIKRLAGIRYQNDRFYDPIRGEHREVEFGFLSYPHFAVSFESLNLKTSIQNSMPEHQLLCIRLRSIYKTTQLNGSSQSTPDRLPCRSHY